VEEETVNGYTIYLAVKKGRKGERGGKRTKQGRMEGTQKIGDSNRYRTVL
jgi:hypothetical protein